MSKPHIALIGLGLIGSSLGHAFKKYGLTDHITGYARSPETRARAGELGFVDAVVEAGGDPRARNKEGLSLHEVIATHTRAKDFLAILQQYS